MPTLPLSHSYQQLTVVGRWSFLTNSASTGIKRHETTDSRLCYRYCLRHSRNLDVARQPCTAGRGRSAHGDRSRYPRNTTHVAAGCSIASTATFRIDAELQHLIDQMNRVADASDRRAGLGILFSRLSDIDPHSALAMAGRMPYAAEPSIESSIWRAWGRLDLEAALQAAGDLTPLSRKSRAAQAIYGAYGYAGNEITEHIEEVLGVKPSRTVRALYLQSLAANSAQSAIDYVNDMRPISDQPSAAWTLGDYLGRTLAEQAQSYSHQLKNTQARSYFERGVLRALASVNPAAVIERYLADPMSQANMGEIGNALTQLAATDLDQAIRYFDVAQSQQARQQFGMSIIQALARDDPARAIEWASQINDDLGKVLHQQAIMIVANTSPAIAMEAANRIPDDALRSSAIASIIGTMAQSDPMMALGALEQLPEGNDKQRAARHVLRTWVQTDPQAALDWAMDNRDRYGENLLRSASMEFIRRDPQTAIRVLPRLDEQTANEWSIQIVSHLAASQSLAAAESFMQQHKNSPVYADMQATLISQIAQRDYAKARNMVDNMQPGSQRDKAIVSLMSSGRNVSEPQYALINSVSDDNMRLQAAMNAIYRSARSDPQRAGSMLHKFRLNDAQRAQLEELIEQFQQRGVHFD